MSVLSALKTRAKQILIDRQHKKYNNRLLNEKKNYNDWIREKEDRIRKTAGNPALHFMPYAECGGDFYEKIINIQEAVVVFHAEEGEIPPLAKSLIGEFFTDNPESVLVYGDEDRIRNGDIGATDEARDRVRLEPWFKPDWSPDTFLSYFYFGSIFAVRKQSVVETVRKMRNKGELQEEPEDNLYRMCLLLAEEMGGFTRRKAGEIDRFPVGHISEVLFHGKQAPEIWRNMTVTGNAYTGQLISVIIPSKDNPEVLIRCITSFMRHEGSSRYHFIIVDNGSSEANKERIGSFLEKLNQERALLQGIYPQRYLYDTIPFNFSRMCNLGAEAVPPETELLLFLNDDMEIIQDGWLERLAGKALLPYVGAVGAKLLYPDTDIIQHAGITNLRVGPAHKLQFLSDSEEHYFGKNRGVHNVAAVTGACLMVKKSVYREAGGFPEELAVAFNDVDLCYSIWESGYYNVVCNDVILFHHESLSRGKDGESEEKRIRLLRENDILYQRHRNIYGKDPFYHKYLMTDMLKPEYVPAFHYEVELDVPWAVVTVDQGETAACPVDACLRVGVECTTDIFKWKYGISMDSASGLSLSEAFFSDDTGYYFQGYSFVIGGDNACYDRALLMKDTATGTILRIAIETRYRPDIRDDLEDQLNVDLTGFTAKVKRKNIPAGHYIFGMLVSDRCSRQKLVNWSERQLIIER